MGEVVSWIADIFLKGLDYIIMTIIGGIVVVIILYGILGLFDRKKDKRL